MTTFPKSLKEILKIISNEVKQLLIVIFSLFFIVYMVSIFFNNNDKQTKERKIELTGTQK